MWCQKQHDEVPCLWKIVWVGNYGKNDSPDIETTIYKNERFVSRTLAHYWETGDVLDWLREGHPRSVCMRQTIHAVCEWVRWKPVCKQKHLTIKMNISKRSQLYFARRLTPWCTQAPCKSFIRCETQKKSYKMFKKLLKRFQNNAHHRILFTDEKISDIEQKFNRQNDCVYTKSCYETKDKIRRVQRGHHPLPLVTVWWVWWGVSYFGATYIHFCDIGIKTNGEVYWAMLNDVLQALEETVCAHKDKWYFQRDSTPTHKVKKTQK